LHLKIKSHISYKNAERITVFGKSDEEGDKRKCRRWGQKLFPWL